MQFRTPPSFLMALLIGACSLTARAADAPTPDSRLVSAARKGDIPAMSAAISAGAKVTYKNSLGETALMNAADENQFIAVRFLLAQGADPAVTNPDGRTALTFALMAGGGSSAVPLIEAFKNPKLLLQSKDTPQSDLYLNIATRYLLINAVNALVDRGVPPDAEDEYGRTPLSIFAENFETETVEKLLERKADPNHKDREGKTPYMWAAEVGAGDAMKALKAAGATPREMPLKPKNWAITQQLSSEQKWALTSAALVIWRKRWSCDLLGGKPQGVDKASSFRLLAFYDIYKDPQAIHRVLNELKTTGERGELLGKWKASQTGSSSLSPQVRDVIRKEGKRHPASGDFLAWDYCRLILVANAGYGSGDLSEAEAWGYILPAARKLKETYTSWKQLSDDYLLARAIVKGEAQDDMTYLQGRLLDPREKASPWRLAWDTPAGLEGWTR
jgi:ankyrin repeat protein